jgi:hypothetical protein
MPWASKWFSNRYFDQSVVYIYPFTHSCCTCYTVPCTCLFKYVAHLLQGTHIVEVNGELAI